MQGHVTEDNTTIMWVWTDGDQCVALTYYRWHVIDYIGIVIEIFLEQPCICIDTLLKISLSACPLFLFSLSFIKATSTGYEPILRRSRTAYAWQLCNMEIPYTLPDERREMRSTYRSRRGSEGQSSSNHPNDCIGRYHSSHRGYLWSYCGLANTTKSSWNLKPEFKIQQASPVDFHSQINLRNIPSVCC